MLMSNKKEKMKKLRQEAGAIPADNIEKLGQLKERQNI
jgi:hypothetical protein